MKINISIVVIVYLFLITSSALATDSFIEFRLADNNQIDNSTKYVINNQAIFVHAELILNHKNIENAELEIQDKKPPTWLAVADKTGMAKLQDKPTVIIHILLNNTGQKILETITARNIGKKLAIFLENELVMAPTIIEAITTGRISIVGDIEKQQAEQIIKKINNKST
jgi:preprotein translocase subunit SecD